jgi:hypothetical protein
MMKSGPGLAFGTTGFEYIRRKEAGHESNSWQGMGLGVGDYHPNGSRSFQNILADDNNVLYHNDVRRRVATFARRS